MEACEGRSEEGGRRGGGGGGEAATERNKDGGAVCVVRTVEWGREGGWTHVTCGV